MAAASNSRLRLHDWPTTPIRAWAHTHARAMELIVDRGPMNAAPHRSGVGSSSARTCRLPAECPLRHRNGDPTTRLQKDLGLVRQRDTPRQCSLVVQAWSAQGNAEGNEVAGDKLLGTSRSPLRPVHIYSGVVVQDDRRRRRATLLKIQRRGVRFRALSYPWTTEHRRPYLRSLGRGRDLHTDRRGGTQHYKGASPRCADSRTFPVCGKPCGRRTPPASAERADSGVLGQRRAMRSAAEPEAPQCSFPGFRLSQNVC
jgi:hypothetical protein